jgi:DNA-binding beta-propeller fold protein YncE
VTYLEEGPPVRLRSVILCATASLALSIPTTARAQGLLDLLGRYDSGLGEAAAEVVAYDAASRRMFVVNAASNSLDVVDLTTPASPSLVTRVELAVFGGGVNSVAVANGLVAVAVQAEDAQAPGTVAFFDTGGGTVTSVQVGALPDMLTFTPDGTRVLVANEGEPSSDYTVDPPGTVSIIDVSGGAGGATVRTVGFDDFDAGGSRAGELPEEVRVFGPGASVSRDLEPEYIAVSPDGGTAFVSLQEANALAVIDVGTAEVERIVALGLKDHRRPRNRIDPSDRDDGIAIGTWPVLGMYMPDAVAVIEDGGELFVLTANEGDARDYDGFAEESRLGDLALDPARFPQAAELLENVQLGRLTVTTAQGDDDEDGDFDRILAFGARSFSVFDPHGELVYDSGDDFESVTAARVPELYNSEENDPGEQDARSDNKGPEPEAITVGAVGDRRLAFVGLERVGGIMVYDVTDPRAPAFLDYEPAAPEDAAPEVVVFVPAAASPDGQALLLVANEISGTVAVYRVGASPIAGTGVCASDDITLCLAGGQFRVRATYDAPGQETDDARVLPLTADTGALWFFNESNLELMVKTLDGCTLNDRFWVFAAGLTDVGVDVFVEDVAAGRARRYTSAQGGAFLPVTDTAAFEGCP